MLNALKSLTVLRLWAGAVFDRLVAKPARLLLRILRAQQKTFAPMTGTRTNKFVPTFVSAMLLSATAFAVTPPNTPINNIATASYAVNGNAVTTTANALVNTDMCVPDTIAFMRYSLTGSVVQPVGTTKSSTSGTAAGPFVPASGPILLGKATPLAVPASYPLAPASVYIDNEPIFVRLVSYDKNINALQIDTAEVTLTSTLGDKELIQLTETGPSTGVFTGYIQSDALAPVVNNNKLSLGGNQTISVTSTDACNGVSYVAQASALVDPFGKVFDTTTGLPLNGATVTIINVATGLPAVVYGNDGVSIFPSTVVTGGTVTDAAGLVYTFPAGMYRFPLLGQGTYRLQITPPLGYHAPSTTPTATLQKLVGAPFAIVVGSRGENFVVNPGPPIQIDIPLDPASTSVSIIKTAGKAVIGTGEFLPYTLAVTNNDPIYPMAGAVIADHLPPGFRYQKGSVRLNGGIMAEPTISPDGTTLTFVIPTLAAAGTVNITYVLQVTAGARTGSAQNVAMAVAPFTSNIARATVLVREDLYRNQSILIGRVVEGSCDDRVDNDAKGLANARIVLQDGTYVLSDKEGRWHIDNLRPGTHVVQLDLDSLPKEYELVACEKNPRFAGRLYSQFVNLRGGSLWRADFYVQKKVRDAAEVAPATVPVKTVPVEDANQLLEVLPYDDDWLATATIGTEWLHPQENFAPNLPVMMVAVKHAPSEKLTLIVNGEAVSGLKFYGMSVNATHTVALSNWRGVAINAGDNKIELIVKDGAGKEISHQVRNIHYGETPDRVEYLPQQSKLIADGKTRSVIAVRLLDKQGYPVRKGVSGDLQLNEPYRAYQANQAMDKQPMTGNIGGKARYQIQKDGIALIELEPTTQSGDVILNFDFGANRKQELRAWLESGQRDWILVGFAEGSVGQKTLSGNMQALQATATDQQLFDKNKVAFYAKGTIRGDYLLTAAYDTAKKTGNSLLKQAVDPTQYYTLYADASQARFDAATASRLYLKIERKQFYALFGDFDTGLTITEFSRYSRTLNGVKSEYQGTQAGYSAFATMTAQAFVKDELPGNGTSGIYKLSRGNIMANSDKIRIEVRDRFQSQIIVSTQNKTRYLDYDIDYATGAVTFRDPIMVRDADFNPVYIVADYESADPLDKRATFGGRTSFKPTEKIKLGATLVHEGTFGAVGNLTGVDGQYQLSDSIKLRGELASTKRNVAGTTSSGNAWLGEMTHRSEAWDGKVYVREQAIGFGIGQQMGSELGMRKIGGDARVKLSDTLKLQSQAYQQTSLQTLVQHSLAEARLDQKLTDSLSAYYGARTVRDTTAAGVAQSSNQMIAGTAYSMWDKKLTLRGSAEVATGTAGSVNSPNRLIFGTDYQVTKQSKVFVQHEIARGQALAANTTRVGVSTQPWEGGEMTASLGNQLNNDSQRVYGNVGMLQRWQINDHWQTNFSIDRSQTLRSNGVVPTNPNAPLPSGTMPISTAPTVIAGDYTTAAFGATYQKNSWSGNGRFEMRNATTGSQRNVQFGWQRKLDEGRAMTAGFTSRQSVALGASTQNSDLRVSYAHRPNDSEWVWFDRADYLTQSSQDVGLSMRTAKLVNNLNANYMPNRRTQIALQYGAKFVWDNIGGVDYKGYTDLLGAEFRYDIHPDWDVGVYGSMMRTVSAGVKNYGLGASLGYQVMENTWLTVGYNVSGLSDRDFAGAGYRAQGAYITLRMKVDQDTLGLNQRKPM